MRFKDSIIITAFPRVHITLIGMNNEGYRINGGLGFALNSPSIEATIIGSALFKFQDNRPNPLNEEEIGRLQSIINYASDKQKFNKNISITIEGAITTHSGFGTGTIIRLLCLEALFLINETPYTKGLLKKLSGRGGTSGVGIRTYFNGGFIFDIGHKQDSISPSNSVEKKNRQSLILKNIKMPNWQFGLCLPHNILSLTNEQEKVFFERETPIRQSSVEETLYHAVYGVYAAIKDNDKEVFQKAINKIQQCQWKNAERTIYNTAIHELETALFDSGAKCVGMSSLGPTLFFTGEDIEGIIEKVKNSIHTKDCTFIVTEANNTGRIINKC